MSTPFDFDDPLKLLESCREIFGHPALSYESAAVYFSAVGTYSKEPLAAALKHWLRHGSRFPTPADIRNVSLH